MHQLIHDAGHARQHLESRRQITLTHLLAHRMQFVQHQFHPQLAGLVLHNEQHFVVVGRARVLGRQDLIERQVVAVAHRLAEVHLRTMPRRRCFVFGFHS